MQSVQVQFSQFHALTECRHFVCSIFLVFEYCTHDLGRLVDAMPRPFSPSEVKCLMLQVCPELRKHLPQDQAADCATTLCSWVPTREASTQDHHMHR